MKSATFKLDTEMDWCYQILGRVVGLAIAEYQSKKKTQQEAKRWLFNEEGSNTLRHFIEVYGLNLNIDYIRRKARTIILYEKEGEYVGMDRADISMGRVASDKVDNRSGVDCSFSVSSVEDEYSNKLSQGNKTGDSARHQKVNI